jgi:type 1 glutamine amidotransferase
MYCNDDWPHPDGPNLIGWTKTVGNSRIVYLQPGDGPDTYAAPEYRRLVENAIRWVAD